MSHEVTDALRRFVAERACHVCEYCLVHEADVYHGCEVDHIISLKHGGQTVAANLAYACFHCNRHKGTDLGSVSGRAGAFVRFYDPRSNRWPEHFQVSDGRIDSLTDLGEVTCRMLDFNHTERVAFRRMLAKIGRYPTVETLARMKE